MTEKTVKGDISTAYEKPLSEYTLPDGSKVEKLSYSGTARQFSSEEEIRNAGVWPNPSAIVKMVNAKEVAKKRAELIKATLDAAGIKAPTLADDSEAIKATAKVLLARKMAADWDSAVAQAKEILGISSATEVADEDEDETV